MTAIYLETSSLLQWLFGQPHAAEVRKRLNEADNILTSTLTIIETERSIIRAENLGHIDGRSAKKLRSLVEEAKAGWVVLGLTPSVQRQAVKRFPVEPLRTLDALHLATAMVFVAAYPDLSIMSYDQRILENAKALRLV